MRPALAALLVGLASAPALAQGAATPSEVESKAPEGTPVDPAEAKRAERAARSWGRGPFEVRDPYLLALSRLSPWMRSPEVLAHGEVGLALRGVWVNSYAFARGRYVIDGELRQLQAVARLGLFDRIELGLVLPYEWRGGGVMDGFIEDFHDAFGIGEMERDQRPRDRYLVAGVERDGSTFQHDHRGYGLSDLVVEARGQLHDGAGILPAATVTTRLRLPTGRRKFELSDGVDATLQLDVSERFGPVIVYVSAAYTYHAKARVDGLEVHRHRGMLGAGFEVELGPYVSLVAHAWTETPRETALWEDARTQPPGASGEPPYGNLVSYVAFGFKLEPVDGLLIELGGLENIVDPEVTADFGLLGNVSYRF